MKAAAGAAGRAATPRDTGGETAPVPRRQTMRAIVQAGYGSTGVLHLAEIGQGSFAEYARRSPVSAAGPRPIWSPLTRQRLTMLISRQRRADLETLARLIEADQLTPVVGKTHPLRQAPDAMRHLQAGHARGKLVLTVTDAG